MTYASSTDVIRLLGTIGSRLPSWVNVDEFLAAAHAETADRLGRVYPDGDLPGFAGTGLAVVALAEAKIAAAEILEGIRVNLPDLGEAPDRLRASAHETLSRAIPGYPPGGDELDDDGDPGTPPRIIPPSPRVSSFTPLSAFPDPYAAARDSSRRFE